MSETAFALMFTGLLTFGLGVSPPQLSQPAPHRVGGRGARQGGYTDPAGGCVQRGMLPLVQSLIVTFIIVETILAGVLLAIIVICQRTNGSLDVKLLSRLRG